MPGPGGSTTYAEILRSRSTFGDHRIMGISRQYTVYNTVATPISAGNDINIKNLRKISAARGTVAHTHVTQAAKVLVGSPLWTMTEAGPQNLAP